MDVVKVAHILANHKEVNRHLEPFWDEAAQLLIRSVIAFLLEADFDSSKERSRNLHTMFKLLEMIKIDERDPEGKDDTLEEPDYGEEYRKMMERYWENYIVGE